MQKVVKCRNGVTKDDVAVVDGSVAALAVRSLVSTNSLLQCDGALLPKPQSAEDLCGGHLRLVLKMRHRFLAS